MNQLRKRVMELSKRHGLTHVGSNLSAVEIIDEIYSKMRPQDKFVLSAGHAHLAHLVVMEKYGIENLPKYPNPIPYSWSYQKDAKIVAEKSLLNYGIHCDRRAGCEVSTGSLGNGLPIAVGMALADETRNVYCLISDGECMEGSIWESLRLAAKFQLLNLKVYCNANGYGGMEAIDSNDLKKKLNKFFPVKVKISNMNPLKGLEAHYQKV